jgi:hypothetical protein
MFVAFSINAEGSDQHQVGADVQPVDLDDQEVQLGRSDAIHSASRSADSVRPDPGHDYAVCRQCAARPRKAFAR